MQDLFLVRLPLPQALTQFPGRVCSGEPKWLLEMTASERPFLNTPLNQHSPHASIVYWSF